MAAGEFVSVGSNAWLGALRTVLIGAGGGTGERVGRLIGAPAG